MKHPVRILMIDIETAPHTAHIWGLFKQTVSINQILDTGRVMCAAWRFRGDKGGIQFASEVDGREKMLLAIYDAIEQADIVVTYNGKKFDIPTLNKEFFVQGWKPPTPTKQVDLYQTARTAFRFASNKLDHLARELSLCRKIRHVGHELWIKCMAGDPSAWKQMERYNKRDVLILDKLYDKMLPWISNHPNIVAYAGDAIDTSRPLCPACGSHKLQRRGYTRTKVLRYNRYQCMSCGTWSRSRSMDKQQPRLEITT